MAYQVSVGPSIKVTTGVSPITHGALEGAKVEAKGFMVEALLSGKPLIASIFDDLFEQVAFAWVTPGLAWLAENFPLIEVFQLVCEELGCKGIIDLGKPTTLQISCNPIMTASAFPCLLCGRLHWKDGIPVSDRLGVPVYLIEDEIVVGGCLTIGYFGERVEGSRCCHCGGLINQEETVALDHASGINLILNPCKVCGRLFWQGLVVRNTHGRQLSFTGGRVSAI